MDSAWAGESSGTSLPVFIATRMVVTAGRRLDPPSQYSLLSVLGRISLLLSLPLYVPPLPPSPNAINTVLPISHRVTAREGGHAAAFAGRSAASGAGVERVLGGWVWQYLTPGTKGMRGKGRGGQVAFSSMTRPAGSPYPTDGVPRRGGPRRGGSRRGGRRALGHVTPGAWVECAGRHTRPPREDDLTTSPSTRPHCIGGPVFALSLSLQSALGVHASGAL